MISEPRELRRRFPSPAQRRGCWSRLHCWHSRDGVFSERPTNIRAGISLHATPSTSLAPSTSRRLRRAGRRPERSNHQSRPHDSAATSAHGVADRGCHRATNAIGRCDTSTAARGSAACIVAWPDADRPPTPLLATSSSDSDHDPARTDRPPSSPPTAKRSESAILSARRIRRSDNPTARSWNHSRRSPATQAAIDQGGSYPSPRRELPRRVPRRGRPRIAAA